MQPEMLGDRQSRVYQVAAKNQVIQALRDGHRRICIVSPTGSGKTHIAGLIFNAPELREVLQIPADRPLRVLLIAHRHRLLKQANDTYGKVAGTTIVQPKDYKNTELYKHYAGEPSNCNILFITQSIFSTIPADLEWDIVFFDECHHESVLTLQHKLEQISVAPIIGMTATLERNDGVLCKFSKVIETISRDDAVAGGFIAQSSLFSFIDSPAREHVDMVMDIVDLKKTELGQTMVFVRTRHEARDVQKRLIKLGMSAVALVDMKEAQLNTELANFEQKKVQFVISCNKIGEGVDVKGCESVIIGRTTGSLPLLNQLIGRTARIDSDSRVYEIINPLSNANIDATAIVTPAHHEIWYKVRGQWRHHVVQ